VKNIMGKNGPIQLLVGAHDVFRGLHPAIYRIARIYTVNHYV
jgi:hypothetical protein